jgi:hypothetical protein
LKDRPDCGRASKILAIAAMLLVSCTQESPDTTSAPRPAASPTSAITPELPNKQSKGPRPGRAPAPVPVETVAVSNPLPVSLHRFAPADAQVVWARPVAQGRGIQPQLVLTWERRSTIHIGHRRIRRPVGPVREVGLLLWQYTGRQNRWNVIYRVQHRGFKGVIRAGPPGHLRRSGDDGVGVFAIGVHVGDLTGDGHPDLLTREEGTGTGGCSFFRVLATERGRLRQIRLEETCETEMDITQEGLLRIKEATYGKRCEHIHGCGTRIRRLRWTGSAWEEVGRNRL